MGGFAVSAMCGLLALLPIACGSADPGDKELGVSCDEPITPDEVAMLVEIGADPELSDLCDPLVRWDLVADTVYLDKVNGKYVTFDSDRVAVGVGRGTCELIERSVLNGFSVPDAKALLLQQMNLAGVYSRDDNRTIVWAAIDSYCPEYKDN